MLKKIFPVLLLSLSVVFMATSISSVTQANGCTSQGPGWTCEPDGGAAMVMCINSADPSDDAACGTGFYCCHEPPTMY
jgi:hypothetical protein